MFGPHGLPAGEAVQFDLEGQLDELAGGLKLYGVASAGTVQTDLGYRFLA